MLTIDPDPGPTNINITIYIVILCILVILSGFFSMSETAFTSFNEIRMENLAKKSKSAKLALKLKTDYDRLLSTILIGNNIVNIAASSIATVLFTKYYGDLGPTIATIVITLVVLIFGEISPKSIAFERPELIARLNAYLLCFLNIVFYPLTLTFTGIKKLITRFFPVKNDPVYTEEEFQMLVEDIHEDGVLNEIESNIIQNTIEYGDTIVEEIMLPAKNIEYIKDSDSIDKISEKFVLSNKSRLVVTKTANLNSAYGVLHQKDFFEMLFKKSTDLKSIIIKDPIIAKPSHKISRLLKKFQSKHQHLALVRDLQNKLVGIVTMEDILEELVGEIKDENDDD